MARFNNERESYFDNDSADDDPNAEYVRLKMKLDSLSGWRRAHDETADDAFVRELRVRLAAVKNHYFFDEGDAEAQYRVERQKADRLDLQAKLRANEAPVPPISPPPAKKRPAPLQSPPPETPQLLSDLFDAEGDDTPVGMFDILEPLPNEEVTDAGTTVTIRDMTLPKHWSGRTPKTLLTEIVHKVAILTFCKSSCARLIFLTFIVRSVCCCRLPLYLGPKSSKTCCRYDPLGWW